jgi:hypothetical protein
LVTSVGRLPGGRLADEILARVAQLSGGAPLSSAEARTLFPAYLEAVASLTKYVDHWGAA